MRTREVVETLLSFGAGIAAASAATGWQGPRALATEAARRVHPRAFSMLGAFYAALLLVLDRATADRGGGPQAVACTLDPVDAECLPAEASAEQTADQKKAV